MTTLNITINSLTFKAKLEEEAAPQTCEVILKMLPLQKKIIQARWSGEAAWVPMGNFDLGVGYEKHTSHPAPGELLIYPGFINEIEILFPYGGCLFAAKQGQLAGNHFATIVEGRENIKEMGRLVLWEGAQDFLLELA